MKRIVPSLLVLGFPYTIIYWLYAAYTNSLPENWTIVQIVGCIIGAWLLCVVGSLSLTFLNSMPGADAYAVAKQNMFIKLIQIQAYIFLFVTAGLCSMIIFTWGITVVIVLTDAMSIALTGIAGVSAVAKCGNDGVIRPGTAAWFGISQFIYVVDVICAIILFICARKQRKIVTMVAADAEHINEEHLQATRTSLK